VLNRIPRPLCVKLPPYQSWTQNLRDFLKTRQLKVLMVVPVTEVFNSSDFFEHKPYYLMAFVMKCEEDAATHFVAYGRSIVGKSPKWRKFMDTHGCEVVTTESVKVAFSSGNVCLASFERLEHPVAESSCKKLFPDVQVVDAEQTKTTGVDVEDDVLDGWENQDGRFGAVNSAMLENMFHEHVEDGKQFQLELYQKNKDRIVPCIMLAADGDKDLFSVRLSMLPNRDPLLGPAEGSGMSPPPVDTQSLRLRLIKGVLSYHLNTVCVRRRRCTSHPPVSYHLCEKIVFACAR